MFFSRSFDKHIILFIVSLALFMEALDGTILNTAIPSMSRSLNVDPIDLKIALISYLLSLAVFIPISGWVADKYGIKRIFMTALICFTVSSLWCGFAHSLPELVIARILQGFGGALMLPVGRLILLRTFGRHEMIEIMNRVVMVGAFGLMLGPVLGGMITHHFSWNWIFWVNIPVGLLAIGTAYYYLQDAPPESVPPLDILGFLFFGGGLAGLTFSLSALSESSIPEEFALMAMGISILLLISYFFYSRKQPHPIVKTKLFRYRTFQVAVVGNLFARIGFGGIPFLLPLLLQIGLGYTSQSAGFLLAPIAAGVVMVKVFTVPLLRFFGYKKLLILNTLFVGISLLLFIFVNANTPTILIGFFTFLFGCLISLQYGSMNSLAYADIASEELSAATSIMSTTQQLAQSFGVAMSALLIHFFAPGNEESALTPQIFYHSFIALSLITVLSIFIFLRLKPADGKHMIKGMT